MKSIKRFFRKTGEVIWEIIKFPFRIIGKCFSFIMEFLVELFT